MFTNFTLYYFHLIIIIKILCTKIEQYVIGTLYYYIIIIYYYTLATNEYIIKIKSLRVCFFLGDNSLWKKNY